MVVLLDFIMLLVVIDMLVELIMGVLVAKMKVILASAQMSET